MTNKTTEAVARAIMDTLTPAAFEEFSSESDLFLFWESLSVVSAQAAITALLDAMMEPSEEVLNEGFRKQQWMHEESCLDFEEVKAVWQAMLTQFRKELEG